MLLAFRVSELQMLLGYAGRNKSGRKTELQQRAQELLRTRSVPYIHQKIRELYKTIQQSGVLNNNQGVQTTTGNNNDLPNISIGGNMSQSQGGMPRATATVPPYNVDTRITRQAAMYNQTMSYPSYPQYTPKPPPPLVSGQYPVLPDVHFKRLPFFDILSELIKPSSLVPQNTHRIQEGTFYFHLTPAQATDIASSRDVRHGSKCEYTKQVQMRFCLLETTCEQEDFFPPSVVVKVNNKLCPLPNPVPTNKPGVEPKRPPRPVNITPLVKLSPTVPNTIHVSWGSDYVRGYALTVALVHKRTSQDLLQRLKSKGAKHSDYTRGLIKEKLNEDADCEIATTSLRVSLICPLGKMRMMTPCRAITCQHLQCFDASLFLQMNERKPTWNCPVCDKPALYDNLVIDGYFQEVLSSPVLNSELNEIQLHKDGSWSTHMVEKKTPAPVVKVQKPTDDSIEIISDDLEVVSSAEVKPTPTTTTTEQGASSVDGNGKAERSIVDLTISDSDDEEPLAKRTRSAKPDSTNKLSDSISSSSNQSRTPANTPGPSTVSSSGYPPSPAPVISVDSPSPPRSPHIFNFSNEHLFHSGHF
ncbi:E3 SUMO-protein ligase PIAS2 isoform X2 [Onthophagus taurus]|nr:E3 SUMO-protein ligase PIAS2 isoform X2 [Onthophagus taurus]